MTEITDADVERVSEAIRKIFYRYMMPQEIARTAIAAYLAGAPKPAEQQAEDVTYGGCFGGPVHAEQIPKWPDAAPDAPEVQRAIRTGWTLDRVQRELAAAQEIGRNEGREEAAQAITDLQWQLPMFADKEINIATDDAAQMVCEQGAAAIRALKTRSPSAAAQGRSHECMHGRHLCSICDPAISTAWRQGRAVRAVVEAADADDDARELRSISDRILVSKTWWVNLQNALDALAALTPRKEETGDG